MGERRDGVYPDRVLPKPFALAPALMLVLTVASAPLLEREACAYVCTPVPSSNPAITQAWVIRCIPYFISRKGTLLGGEERRQLIAQSFRVWTTNACTDLELTDAGYTDEIAAFDPRSPSKQKNVIASIEDRQELGVFPDPSLLAITLTSFSTESGEIFDADILLNRVTFKFDDVVDVRSCEAGQPGERVYDLRNTLIHEMGHFIGFDHDFDDESTMFASAMPCETKKRDLTDDNRLGLCTTYATAQTTKTCRPPPRGYDAVSGDPSRFRDQCERLTGKNDGCACLAVTEGGRARPPTAIALLFLGVALARWRRRAPAIAGSFRDRWAHAKRNSAVGLG